MRVTNGTHRGFTLVEAMCASTILSLSVVALSSSMVASTQQSIGASAKISALNAAQSGMETLNGHPLSDMYSSSGGTVQTIASSTFPTQTGLTTQGQVSFINRSAKQGSRDLAVVQVTSTSADGGTVTLYRLISKEGNGR